MAFARAVAADNSQNLALLDLEADILERPEFLNLVALNDLSAANNVDSFTGNVADLPPNHVAQSFEQLWLDGPPIFFGQVFRRWRKHLLERRDPRHEPRRDQTQI